MPLWDSNLPGWTPRRVSVAEFVRILPSPDDKATRRQMSDDFCYGVGADDSAGVAALDWLNSRSRRASRFLRN